MVNDFLPKEVVGGHKILKRPKITKSFVDLIIFKDSVFFPSRQVATKKCYLTLRIELMVGFASLPVFLKSHGE